jgi:hypothetical protein
MHSIPVVAFGNTPWLGVTLVLLGCGSSLPAPETGIHSKADYEEVPYPPPAAAPEIVPDPPSDAAVWINGQWVWRARYYVWERGGWVIPPPRSYYAPSNQRYAADGTLYYAEGAWLHADSRERLDPPPPIVLPAATPPSPHTPEPALSP